MKNRKRNLTMLAVMMFVCAAVALNWSYNSRWGKPDAEMVYAEDEAMLAAQTAFEKTLMTSGTEYFAEARLTRQVSRDEALELLLSYAIFRQDTNAAAHRLMDHFGSLHSVLEASPEELMRVEGVGENAASLISLMLPIQRMYGLSRSGDKAILDRPDKLRELCAALFTGARNEQVYVLSLDSCCRLIGSDRLLEGTPDHVSFYPRQVAAVLLRRGAVGAVLAHNHPTGDPTPSSQDLNATNTIASALAALDIRLYDHIIVAGERQLSFREEGYLRDEIL